MNSDAYMFLTRCHRLYIEGMRRAVRERLVSTVDRQRKWDTCEGGETREFGVVRASEVRVEYSQKGADMSQTETTKALAAKEQTEEARSFVGRVRTATRRKYTAEEKFRIVLEGFRREVAVNELCRREGIKPHSYYSWTTESMEAGKE